MIEEAMDQLESAVAAIAELPPELANDAQVCGVLRRLVGSVERLDGLSAAWLEQLDDRRAYEVEGASTAASWARRELRWDVKTSRAAIAAGRTMRILPKVGAARRAGEISGRHVAAFTVVLRKADRVVVEAAEDVMVEVARTCEPATLVEQLTMLAEAAHPEELDRAWAAGMDKHDLKVARAGEGFHVNGFLDVVAGERFQSWLAAAAAPRGEDDKRSPAQRRVDAVGDLAAAVLEHGMPSDRGVRPQLQVLVEAGWLAGQAGAASPVLSGWGPVGDKLFDYLTCGADRTDLLVDGMTDGPTPQAKVLNVGRTRRFATKKQRRAVHARQAGTCANPGCGSTRLELHHVVWWSHGGATDLDVLVGLCTRCHQMIHAGRLAVATDGVGGFVFSRMRHGRVTEIEDYQRVRRVEFVERLRQIATGMCQGCHQDLDHAAASSHGGRSGGAGSGQSGNSDSGRRVAAACKSASAVAKVSVRLDTPANADMPANSDTPTKRTYGTGGEGSGHGVTVLVRRFSYDDICRAAADGQDLARLRPRHQQLIQLRT